MALLSGGMSSYGLHPRRGTRTENTVSGVLDDFVTADHLCSVIDAFVEKLSMSELGMSALRRLGRDDLATIRAIC